MKLIFKGKKELLDIEDFEYRQEFDFGFFLFEFLAFVLKVFTPNVDADLPEIFLRGEGDPAEILQYLVNAERNVDALHSAQALLRSACEFCLDMDYDGYPLGGLSAQQKWYILSKSGEYTDLRAFIEQFSTLSEHTSIVQPGELFYSDSLLHTDTDEADQHFEEPLNISDLIEKYRAVALETLKIYETDSLSGLLYAEFWGMVTGNARIRKCKFCGKYFIPFSENAEYCARTVPGKGKSCKGYAPMVLFRRKLAEDELQSVYAKAKAAHYMRYKRNPGLYTLEQFDKWNEKAKEALGRARREGMTAVELKMTIQSDMVW